MAYVTAKLKEAAPPGMGTLSVDTSPVKGEVFVDGASQGKAPIIVNVAVGLHTISFGSVPRYAAPPSQMRDVAEGETVTVMGIYVLSWLPYVLLGGGAVVLVVAVAARKK